MNLIARSNARITVSDEDPAKCSNDCFFANSCTCGQVRECVLYRSQIKQNVRPVMCLHDFRLQNTDDFTKHGGI